MNCKVCGNTSAKSTSVSFFRFPKENSKCRDWADRCDLLELFEKHGTLRFYKSFRICSQHFDPKDVVFDGRKKRLLHSAAPLRSTTVASSSVQKDVKDFNLQFPQNLCRLCAGENENLTEIFGWRGKLLNLEKKLKYFPQVINRNDILPLKICSQCESKVNQFYDFIIECTKAENKLRAMLEPKDSQPSHQLPKTGAEGDGIDWGSEEVKSLNQTPKIIDSLDPKNCFQESMRPNYYDQVLEENFICGDEADYLSRVAVTGFTLSDHSNSHTNFIRVDFSRNISFQHDYSNKVSTNELQSEMQMTNDKNFEEVSKFSSDICFERFNNSEGLKVHSLEHSVQSDLHREHLNELHDKDFYNRLQLEENVSYAGSKAFKVCDRFHEVALLDEISFAQIPCNQSKDFSRNRHIRRESETKAHLKRVLKCDQTKSGLHGEQGHSGLEGEGRQFRQGRSREGNRLVRGKAGNEQAQRCDECGKFFRSKASLRQHKSVHSDKRLYGCQECGLSFKRKDTLCNHLRIHTGERPFVCKVCGFAFKQRGDCKKHEKNHNRDSEIVSKAGDAPTADG